jgi:hypothetical protein
MCDSISNSTWTLSRDCAKLLVRATVAWMHNDHEEDRAGPAHVLRDVLAE